MLVDTHAHLNFKDYQDDYQAVLKRAHDKGVAVINVGSQISTSRRAAEIAKEYDKTFAAVGLHPLHLHSFEVKEEHAEFTTRAEDYDAAAYQELAKLDQVVAIGEVGLDYHYLIERPDAAEMKHKQKQVLTLQIDLANQQNLPMILHCRNSTREGSDALEDLLELLIENMPARRGVMHSFPGDWALAQKFIKLGFYLGYNGIITFDKSGRTADVISQARLENLLLETDCPYLTPEPYRGQRNEPAYVEFVAQKIAEIKRLDFEQVARITTQNAKKLFNLSI